MDFKQFPKSARDFLTKYKDAKISNFVIRKNPIQSGVEKVLNFVSQGKYNEIKQDYAYDTMYHLRLDFEIDGKYFAEIDENHKHYPITHSARPKEFSIITKIDDETKKAVSFFGDSHPNFEGNVVKAMASAKIGHA